MALMINYINETRKSFLEKANRVNTDELMENMLQSFTSARNTERHYIVVASIDFNEYLSEDQILSFETHGFYREEVSQRFDNMFFVGKEQIDSVINLIKDEKMMVNKVKDGTNPDSTVFVVTTNGIENSNFKQDYQKKQ